jgi:putative copper export protein/mono/diheme cytochrome c family protein
VSSALGLFFRWAHLAFSLLVVGSFSTLLLAGRSDRPTAQRWERQVLVLSRVAWLLAIVSGLAGLGYQTALLEGRARAAFEMRPLLRVLLDTQGGNVWLVRHGLLILLGALVFVRADLTSSTDWIAARGEAFLLGVCAAALLAAAGHAAAVMPDTGRALTIDVLHLVATAVWMGGLVPLALLLRAAGRDAGEDARPYAVLATRRFSDVALGAVLVLVLTGVLNAVIEVGSVAGLLGTNHGRLLIVKLLLLAPILALGAMNRRRLVPELSGPSDTVGRPAMRRLARTVGVETLLALSLLAIVAAMTVSPPARHESPTWPFSFRLSWAASTSSAARARVLVGSQAAVLGLVAVLASRLLPRQRGLVLTGGLVVLVAGVVVAVPAFAVDAYPTTYRRPAVAYQAPSIVSGAKLYRQHCEVCHGAASAGDGPRASTLARPPRDLRGGRIVGHTAGDVFWWITHGVPDGGMPAFGLSLTDSERWDLVNFIRALDAGRAARALGPTVEPDRPRLVAPDFPFAVGPAAPHMLRDSRGERTVLLVLYTLPGSRPRITQLAQSSQILSILGVEIVAVPTDASPDAIRQLGPEPRVLFPVVTDGAADIVETYRLFADAPHAEFLIDRQGYLRAISTLAPGETSDVNRLLAEVQQLNEEKVVAPMPAEHVH